MTAPTAPAPALPSASVLLLRDGRAGLEVFMVERHHAMDFASRATVFPGGKVDEGDWSVRARASARGARDLAAYEAALRIAALRETFEECGVLLARPAGRSELVSAPRLQGIAERYREHLRSGAGAIDELLAGEDLELACDLLVPFSRWITPKDSPKRFDTFFYLAAAPADQAALHDGYESVDSLWTTVADAADDAAAGRRKIILPTLANLRLLGESASVAEALVAASRRRVEPILL
ncbi:MAG: NUDIX domain-containing protein [Deltaproteobacteria bacterium]|nr:NUDIX domain-containing protein [Deltaproteobacteria bacterium]